MLFFFCFFFFSGDYPEDIGGFPFGEGGFPTDLPRLNTEGMTTEEIRAAYKEQRLATPTKTMAEMVAPMLDRVPNKYARTARQVLRTIMSGERISRESAIEMIKGEEMKVVEEEVVEKKGHPENVGRNEKNGKN